MVVGEEAFLAGMSVTWIVKTILLTRSGVATGLCECVFSAPIRMLNCDVQAEFIIRNELQGPII